MDFGTNKIGCISMSGGLVTGSCRGSLGAGQPLFWGLVSWLSGPFGPRSLFYF